ncbi:MAG: formate dehydrogenase accessory sulfurtransferase FdhD [Thermodesulfobacteriota bacterium]
MNDLSKAPGLTVDIPAIRYESGHAKPMDVPVAAEIPYTLFVNDREILSISTLPCNLKELFVGFLVSEGVLLARNEILTCHVDHPGKIVMMELDVPDTRLGRIEERGMLTSGCAGGMVFSVMTDPGPPRQTTVRPGVPARSIVARMGELDKYQGIYRVTRGVHGASLATRDKTLVILEDLGRHNAVDKIVGHCFLEGIETSDKLLLTTGRVTSEVLTKASHGGFPLVISRSSASAMALHLARQFSIDVATYVRAGRFNYFANGGAELVVEEDLGTVSE